MPVLSISMEVYLATALYHLKNQMDIIEKGEQQQHQQIETFMKALGKVIESLSALEFYLYVSNSYISTFMMKNRMHSQFNYYKLPISRWFVSILISV